MVHSTALPAPAQKLLHPGLGRLLIVVVVQHHSIAHRVAAEEALIYPLGPVWCAGRSPVDLLGL